MCSRLTLRVLQIVPGTSVDGPGLRTSIYLAGCQHCCPGCHNPDSWDFAGGTPMSPEEVAETVIAHGFNVTLTGGDPLQHAQLEAVEKLIELLTEAGLKIWCYTGYNIEEINSDSRLLRIIQNFEALVEGPYISALNSPELPFRGSSNQRIIRPNGTPIPYYDNPLSL